MRVVACAPRPFLSVHQRSGPIENGSRSTHFVDRTMKLTLQEMRYALSGQPEFRFAEYEGMTVGCYMIADETSFLTNYGRECRGVTFDTATGRCIGRPFPKFFNVNERPDTQAGVIDWSKLAHVYEKRDGSLTHT